MAITTKLSKPFYRAQIKAAPLLNNAGLAQDIGRTLIIAPHPDDEALGCGGLIALLRSQNAEVHVVFMTNGGASHPNSRKYDTLKLQALRKSEAIKSCLVLNVLESNIHFLELEDSKLHSISKEQKRICYGSLSLIFELCDFDSVVMTWRRDAHSDHRETYNLISEFIFKLENFVQIIEYPIWLWTNGSTKDWPNEGEVEPYRLNVVDVLDMKINAINQHITQTTRFIDDDINGFILTPELIELFTTKYEYFLFTPHRNNATLDAGYFKRLYNDSNDPWDFRNSNYERKKYLQTLKFLKYYRFKNALEIGCSIGEHSNLLSRHCDHLISVDISMEAIKTAKEKFKDNAAIEFEVWDVTNGLPKGDFDLVTLCEVCYYLNNEDLTKLYKAVDKQLNIKGYILLVHWTSYVREYPLSGTQVHRIFENLEFVKGKYEKIESYTHELYKLMLWQKTKCS